MTIPSLCSLCIIFITYIHLAYNKYVGPSRNSEEDSDESWTRKPASNISIENAVDEYVKMNNMEPPKLKALAEVFYPSGYVLQPPNMMKYKDIEDEPLVKWPIDDPKSLYVLAFIHAADPDDVYRVFEQNLNWLVVNIPGNNLKAGNTLLPYRRPRAPTDQEKDAYAFLIYKQPTTTPMHFNLTEILPEDPRKVFVIEEFVHVYGLGYPVAGNFFKIET